MEIEKIQSSIESILFVSGEPVKKTKLAKILLLKQEELDAGLTKLAEKYAKPESGLMLVEKEDQLQLVSKAENALQVEGLVKGELQDALSVAAMEVLAIIAYRGPISKPEIEAIRGVNCSYTLRNLMLRGLIERGENSKDARGYVYSVTLELLKKLGLEDVKKLPDYVTLSVDERLNSSTNNVQ